MRVAVTLEQCWHRVPGGTAVAALRLVDALAVQPGVDLVGVAARHRRPPAEGLVPSVPVRQLPLPRAALYESWHGVRRPVVQRASGDVDVIHATTIVVPPRSAPLVVTIHDLAFVHDPSGFTRRGLRFFRRGLELARAEADAVVCSSTATLEDCAGHGFDRSRLHLVPLGVHVVPTGPAQVAAARHRYGLGRPYLLFAGTQEPRKNLARLVEAFALLAPDRELVLAGPTGWGDQQAPAPGVRAVGFVPEADLRALYAGADAFVYPSVREGFGLPVLEAMAQGTPVVTSRRTSTEEVAGGAAVLVDPLDPADIARGITEAIDRTAELAELGRARAAACSWDRTAELTLDVYGQVTR